MLGNKRPGAPSGSPASSASPASPASPPPAGETKPAETIDTLIGQKAVFKGDLEFTGGLRVDGRVKGNIIAKEESNSTVVISESGEVEGNITVPHVVVNGAVNGNMHSGGRVELQAKAKINGDVHYKAVQMELGASINGNLVCQTAAAAGGQAGRGSGRQTSRQASRQAGREDSSGETSGGSRPAAAKAVE